jgi:alpha-L-fucosidase
MKIFRPTILLLSLMTIGCGQKNNSEQVRFEATWESLAQVKEQPEWFKDVKFGIYFHWGPYSVPAYGSEWYPRHMYEKGNHIFEHHRKVWGSQEKFGYKDFIPLFTAEKFDATEWAELFLKAGAKFAGPVAEHHDGFSMWDSDLTEWDAKDKGPKRDIVGELENAIRKKGLKFVTTFHHAWKWRHLESAFEYDAKDPKYSDLYGEPHEKGAPYSKAYLENWRDKLIEVVNKYQPDYMWFDFGWGDPVFDAYKREYLAYYYNKAKEWRKEVVVTYKNDNLPPGVAVLDLERGRLDTLRKDLWITDTAIGRKSWCYIEDPSYKSLNTLIDNLVDRVSKNGNTLLNIAPRPDGTIPDEQKQLLLGMGKWLKVNGEAIFGTRYWRKYGEGSTRLKGGSFSERYEVRYTTQDIRFTSKEDKVYAICLDWPGKELNIKSIRPKKRSKIYLLGYENKLDWKYNEVYGLLISLPDDLQNPENRPCELAYAFKIVGDYVEITGKPTCVGDVAEDRQSGEYYYYQKADLILQSKTPNAKIYFTTDESEPNFNSVVFKQSIKIDEPMVIKSFAFKKGCAASNVHTYHFKPFNDVLDPVSFSGKLEEGLLYKYYEGSYDFLPVVGDLAPVKQGNCKQVDLSMRSRDENFALHFDGFIEIKKEGLYTFYLGSDDGSKFYLNDQLFIVMDGTQSYTEKGRVVVLQSGFYPIQVDYFNKTGGFKLTFEYSGPGIPKQPIPESSFNRTGN